MKIETKWNLGNFTVALATEANPVAVQQLANLGLLYLGQRNSDVDKILGGFEKKGDKMVRKPGWKRIDVDYSTDLANKLNASFSILKIDEENPIEMSEVSVTEYVPTKAEPKYAREKAKFAEKESTPEGLDGWLERFAGYTGPTHGDDGEYAPAALQAAKVAIDRFLKENV